MRFIFFRISGRIIGAYLRVIALLASATGLGAITFDFSFPTWVTCFWFPFFALETKDSVNFVVTWHVHVVPRGPSGPNDRPLSLKLRVFQTLVANWIKISFLEKTSFYQFLWWKMYLQISYVPTLEVAMMGSWRMWPRDQLAHGPYRVLQGWNLPAYSTFTSVASLRLPKFYHFNILKSNQSILCLNSLHSLCVQTPRWLPRFPGFQSSSLLGWFCIANNRLSFHTSKTIYTSGKMQNH